MSELEQYLGAQCSQFEEDLCELLRIRSVSADSTHIPDVRQAADWMIDQFQGMGLTVELVETDGHPIVYAESPAVEGVPVALIYGHYDVQHPIHWTSGSRRPSSQLGETETSTPAARPTTKAKCSPT